MKWSLTAGILVASLLITMPADTGADDQDQRTEIGPLRRHVIVPAGQVINRDYFAFGEIVEISGTVNGDVYAAGAHVVVDGTVNGDLLAAGGTVTISGTVAHDARVAGGQVTISGQIGGNMTVGSGHVELTPSAVIRGSAVAGGGHVELAAPVERDVKIGAGTVIVSNRIGGNMTAAAGTIRLTSKAVVAGNLIYWTHNLVSIDDQASVRGKTIRREIPEDVMGSIQNLLAIFAGLKLAVTAASFVSTLILGLLLFRFYPISTQQALAAPRGGAVHLVRLGNACADSHSTHRGVAGRDRHRASSHGHPVGLVPHCLVPVSHLCHRLRQPEDLQMDGRRRRLDFFLRAPTLLSSDVGPHSWARGDGSGDRIWAGSDSSCKERDLPSCQGRGVDLTSHDSRTGPDTG